MRRPLQPAGDLEGMGAVPLAVLGEQADHSRRQIGRWLDALGVRPACTPSRRLEAGPVFGLHAYHPPEASGPPILIVPAPIKKAWIWDAHPASSVVVRLLGRGLRVYMVHWRSPAADQSHLGLEDYGGRFLLDCLAAIRDETGQRGALLAGHSLGGTLAAIFAARHPALVRGLVLLESPLCFVRRPGNLETLAAWLPHAGAVTSLVGNVPGVVLDVGASLASPAAFGVARGVDLLLSLANPLTLRLHLLAERWSLDETALPAHLFRQVVEWLYREDRFARGALRLGGQPILPSRIVCPVLAVYDADSTVVPPESIVRFLPRTSGACTALAYQPLPGASLRHLGALLSPAAQVPPWPAIVQWISEVMPIPAARPGGAARSGRARLTPGSRVPSGPLSSGRSRGS